jgi:hypothetical protein
MGTVQQLAEKVKEGLQTALPKRRKTVVNQLALAVGAMLEARTPNPSERVNVLPVPTKQPASREQGWRQLLKKPLLDRAVVLEPFARTALEDGVTERYLPAVRLCHGGVPTNLGIGQEAGHEEPWIIAMDCRPHQAAVRDYGARWVIEPTFSDFKSQGFQWEDTLDYSCQS